MSTTNIPVADITGMPTPVGQPAGLVLATNGNNGFQLLSGSGSGNVISQGTPALNQLAGWVNATTIQGLTLGTNLSITGTTLNATGGGGGTWGSITGTLSNQTDLQTALNAKVATTTTVNGQSLSGNVSITPTTLGLLIGTNVEAWSANLDTWSSKTPYAGAVTVTTAKTLNVTNTLTFSGTDNSTLNVGSGGTLGSNAFNSTSYQPLATNLTSVAGLTYASLSFVKMSASGTFALDTNTYIVTGGTAGSVTNAVTFNNGGSGAASGTTFNGSTAVTVSYNTLGAQPLATNLTSLAALTYVSLGFVKMSASGTFSLDTNTYLTANQSITLSGDTTGSGTTAITTTTAKVNSVAYPASPSTNTVPVVTGTNQITYEAVPNTALANSAITIAGTSTSLGGSITQDTITGLSSTGIIKRTGANTLAIATAGTDYSTPSATETLTNKTISGSNNTLSSIANSSLTNSAITIAGTSTSLGGSITLNTILNSVGSVAQGDILYYNGTNWVYLTPGTSGNYLMTQGASANPIWSALSGGGNVSNSGTPTNGQLAGWTSSTVIQGITIGSGLTLTGTTLTASGGSGSPAGSNTQVQYNASGSFGANSGFTSDTSGNVTALSLTSTNDATVHGMVVGLGPGGSSQNVTIGVNASYSQTTATGCVSIGNGAGYSNTNGNNNVSIGLSAANSNVGGAGNVAIGWSAFHSGSANYIVALGYAALYSCSGSGNTAIGYNVATSITSGTNNTVIGYLADAPSLGGVTNSTALGANAAITASNQMVFGYGITSNLFSGSISGGTYVLNTNVQSSTYTIGSTDGNVAFTGSSATTWAMPATPASGAWYVISNMGTAVLTVTSSNSFFTSLAGQPSITLNPGDVAEVIYINSTWKVS